MPTQLKTFSQYIDSILQPGRFSGCLHQWNSSGRKEENQPPGRCRNRKPLHHPQGPKYSSRLPACAPWPLFKGKRYRYIRQFKRNARRFTFNDISLLAYHLPLDAHQELGNNWPAAKLLGWTDLEPFGNFQSMKIGVKGTVEPTSQEEMKKKLEKFYGHPAQTVFGGKKQIRSCALISGGAHKAIPEAVLEEVDCFITGTTDEPVWHQAHQDKINFYALGHAATETIGVQLLGEHLAEQFNLKLTYIHENNPF